jgi:hypothetical protein
MTLNQFLADTNTSRAEFARQIGVKWVSVDRYCTGRVPEAKVMERIIAVTDGRVTANDFFRLAA